MQAPVRANVQRILSRALVKRLIWHAWNNSSPCSASTRSNIVSSPCVFRTHNPSSSLLVLIRLLSSRHLNDASHRETYESAHSTILAIFAAQLGSTTSTKDQGTGVGRPTFVEKIVPFYMQCLLQVRPTVMFCFSSVIEKVNIYRTRLMESSPPHSCASRITHLRAVQVKMHQRWASFAFPLSSHC